MAAALSKQYPSLTKDEVERVATSLFRWIAREINRGNQLGSFKRLPDGSIDITFLVIDSIVDETVPENKSR